MANMSYCRFENTHQDLHDCLTALENGEISSEDEKKHAKQMLHDFLNYCEMVGIIDNYDVDLLNAIVDECKKMAIS